MKEMRESRDSLELCWIVCITKLTVYTSSESVNLDTYHRISATLLNIKNQKNLFYNE